MGTAFSTGLNRDRFSTGLNRDRFSTGLNETAFPNEFNGDGGFFKWVEWGRLLQMG
jgi:hypothetical protein